MALHPERSPREWYEEAARAHLEGHQACAWCGVAYQVYRAQRGSRLEYYCPACDFFAFHDTVSGKYFAALGRDLATLPQAPIASTSQTTMV